MVICINIFRFDSGFNNGCYANSYNDEYVAPTELHGYSSNSTSCSNLATFRSK